MQHECSGNVVKVQSTDSLPHPVGALTQGARTWRPCLAHLRCMCACPRRVRRLQRACRSHTCGNWCGRRTGGHRKRHSSSPQGGFACKKCNETCVRWVCVHTVLRQEERQHTHKQHKNDESGPSEFRGLRQVVGLRGLALAAAGVARELQISTLRATSYIQHKA